MLLWLLRMIDKKVLADLQQIIEENLDPSMFPYAKGNSIRIGNFVIRKNRHGYNIFDLKHKEKISCVFSKTAAVAIAKNLAKGTNVISQAESFDRIIEKNYNDALFFSHAMRTTKDEFRREVSEMRLDIAKTRTEDARRRLDCMIF